MSLTTLSVRALALAAALALSGPAFAKSGNTSVLQAVGNFSPASLALPTAILTLDVSGIQSYSTPGDPGNAIRTLQLAPGAEVTGIGWDVNITAFAPSWLSEMRISFGDSNGAFVNLTVGNGVNEPGTASYSSGGIVDLVGLGFNFNVAADGLLRMEFFESFPDDLFPDGVWNSGTLTFEVSAVPEPSTYGLMALGLLGVAAAARRRRAD